MSEIVNDYKVLNAINSHKLTPLVLEALMDGWQPLGGVSGHAGVYQAMVRYAPKSASSNVPIGLIPV
jgi:hypothetical protein